MPGKIQGDVVLLSLLYMDVAVGHYLGARISINLWVYIYLPPVSIQHNRTRVCY